MEAMVKLIMFLVLVAVGYTAGTLAEKRHYKSIQERERRFLNLPAVTIRKIVDESRIESAHLVSGSVVISIDYFKRFLAALRNIVGGEVTSYETLVDRARREAILRMKESAPGAHSIINMRLETSTIGRSANRKNSLGSIEVIAYGTAITIKA